MPRPTLRDSHVNRPLTNVSIGYRNDSYIADQVFPIVQVEKKSDVYFIYDKQAWFRDRGSHLRAPGTRAQRDDYTVTPASYICLNYALAKAIPDEVRANADVPLRPDVDATEFVTDGLLLGLEKRVADVVTACANWASASNPGTTWDNDTSDPFQDIDTAVDAVVQQIGRMPTVAVMGWPVWKSLRNHPDFLDRIKHTRSSGRVEPGDLNAWFGFDKVLIGTSVIDSAQEGATASHGYVWGKHFWTGYVAPSAGLMVPSAGYCFHWGSRQIERFREDQEYSDVITGNWSTDEKISASDAGAGFFTAVA
jgi:hypothetical protein